MSFRNCQGRFVISSSNYQKIKSIDGNHPFKNAVPDAYVAYRARVRRGGKVRFFNFSLAKLIGLIPNDHPHELNSELSKVLLETFGLQIINEYDIKHGLKIPEKDIKPNTYMATRYLQLQHPSKKGLTSGDGRSIWNGYVEAKGKIWDITSRGTGATRLSPATAIHKKFYQTGDPKVSYGCGYSMLSEGIIDVLFSEILSRNLIATEQILCVIEYPGDYGITVRAGQNLIRPSHFFSHLKQANRESLIALTNYYIARQVSNGIWKVGHKEDPYQFFLKKILETFAEISAKFEAQYIFCWLDWDGDNILADGGIIDFGSVRQFGLYFHEYRFDDDERWSTTIKEQKQKARYIFQCFIQLIDFVQTGRKKPIQDFRHHRLMKRFDATFNTKKRELLLWRVGFTSEDQNHLLRHHTRKIKRFEQIFYRLEQKKLGTELKKVPDGINRDVLFSMRRILMVLPRHYVKDERLLSPEAFFTLIKSNAAESKSFQLNSYLVKQMNQLQASYLDLVKTLAKSKKATIQTVLQSILLRSNVINCEDRITGDSICLIGEKFTEIRYQVDYKKFHWLIEKFVEMQILNPDYVPSRHEFRIGKLGKWQDFLDELNEVIHEYRESI